MDPTCTTISTARPTNSRISQSPYSSYEIVVEPAAGEGSATIERLAGTTTTVSAVGCEHQRAGDGAEPALGQSDRERLRYGPHSDQEHALSNAGGRELHEQRCLPASRLRDDVCDPALQPERLAGERADSAEPDQLHDHRFRDLWTTGGTLLNGPGHAFTLPAKTALVMNVGMHPVSWWEHPGRLR